MIDYDAELQLHNERLRAAYAVEATNRVLDIGCGTGQTTREAARMDVLAAYVAAGGSVPGAAVLVGIRPSTVKRHLADLRARAGLTAEQLIYAGRAAGWLCVPSLEPP